MAKRSLQASSEGIKQAKQAFKRKGWTQEYLSAEVGLESRQPIWKFFSGRPVDRHVFIEICFVLDLIPEEIAIPPDAGESNEGVASGDIDEFVQKVRSQHADKIQHQCGTLQMLDISRPVGLDDIYVDVNILEEITHQRWLDISQLQAREFEQFGLSQGRGDRLNGLQALENHSKLMVLGKPGAGKTTFLQAIALQCIGGSAARPERGNFQSHCVPIFIRLKNFAEDARDEGRFSLVNYFHRELSGCNVSPEGIDALLSNGRILLLLDGLDEVPEEDKEEIAKQIRKLAETYYKTQLIISCRPAAYQYRFPGFTEVEIADFTLEQIEAFVRKWFVSVARNSTEDGLALATQFMERLTQSANRQIRELAGTPILLNLTCLVFQAKGDFPVLRAKLYQQGLDILLVRWDETRGIRRDNLYCNLSLAQKLKLLSQIAAQTFERGEYFFETSKIKQYIAEYLKTLPDIETVPEVLQRESGETLKSIERQHGLLVEQARGIYSFSHLTFQEYLTSRYLVTNDRPDALICLAERLRESRWREVFLLASGMLNNADEFLELMREKTRGLVSGDSELQQLLDWIDRKSKLMGVEQNLAAIRSFLLTISMGLDRIMNNRRMRGVALASTLVRELSLDLDLKRIISSQPHLDMEMARLIARDLAVNLHGDVTSDTALGSSRLRVLGMALKQDLEAIIERVFDPQLERSLRWLYDRLPTPSNSTWWEVEGEAWIERLKTAMKSQQTIGHYWQLSDRQQDILQQFYNANKLLADCLASAAQVTPGIREEIERTLLLP